MQHIILQHCLLSVNQNHKYHFEDDTMQCFIVIFLIVNIISYLYFVSIVPGYISRSVAGSYDNEGIAIFALLFTYFLWVGIIV